MMLHLFFSSLRRQVRKSLAAVLFLIIGLTVACFCLSAAQGNAMQAYSYITCWTEYATLTIDQSGAAFQNMADFAAWIDTTYGDKVANVLYLTKEPTGEIYVGWQGTAATRWFPISSGRFFTEAEAGDDLIFLQEEDGALDAEEFTLHGRPLHITGRGGILPFQFRLGISRDAPTQLFSEDNTVIRILPYRLFAQMFRPCQILIQFDRLEAGEAAAAREAIQGLLPNAAVFLPNQDADKILSQEAIRGAREGLLLCLIAGVTILQLMTQWIGFLRKELYTYYLCGMWRSRCALLLYGQWLVYLLFSAGMGAGMHRLCFPLLKYFGASVMPKLGIYLLLVGVLYLLSVLCSLWSVRRTLSFHTQGGTV